MYEFFRGYVDPTSLFGLTNGRLKKFTITS